MSVESTRKTIMAYGQDLLDRGDYARHFAPDVVMSVMGTDQEAHGPQAVEGMIRYLHEQAFDANPELRGFICEDGRCALEAVFVGTHTGEFAGVPPTGRQVNVPYSVIYDLEGEKIKALRIYGLMDLLLAQIGAGRSAAEAGVG